MDGTDGATRDVSAPSAWLVANRRLLPPSGDALDLACGRGRNALWLAAEGFRTHAIDRDGQALETLRALGAARGWRIDVRERDLETGASVLEPGAYDVIVVVHYLHRALFPQILAALRPGGVLVYETFTTAQAARGRPTNPAFLLEPGELRGRVTGEWPGTVPVPPMAILAEREGEFDGRMVAGVVARRLP